LRRARSAPARGQRGGARRPRSARAGRLRGRRAVRGGLGQPGVAAGGDPAYGNLPGLTMNGSGRPGLWLFHCHVNDHLRAGMLALYRVT